MRQMVPAVLSRHVCESTRAGSLQVVSARTVLAMALLPVQMPRCMKVVQWPRSKVALVRGHSIFGLSATGASQR